MKTKLVSIISGFALCLFLGGTALAQAKKPNILIMWGDDVGLADVRAYSFGVIGFETPNIDRVTKEGIRFPQYCGEQSCT